MNDTAIINANSDSEKDEFVSCMLQKSDAISDNLREINELITNNKIDYILYNNDEIRKKLTILKENLLLDHPEDLEVVRNISDNINQLLTFIDSLEKPLREDEEDWILITAEDCIDDNHKNNLEYSYVEILRKLSNNYLKLADVYNKTADLCSLMYKNARPLIGLTQFFVSLYQGGPMCTFILIWSWWQNR